MAERVCLQDLCKAKNFVWDLGVVLGRDLWWKQLGEYPLKDS